MKFQVLDDIERQESKRNRGEKVRLNNIAEFNHSASNALEKTVTEHYEKEIWNESHKLINKGTEWEDGHLK